VTLFVFQRWNRIGSKCRKCNESTTCSSSSTSAMEYHLKKCNIVAWNAMKSQRSAAKSKPSSSNLLNKWADTDLRSIAMDKHWLNFISVNFHHLLYCWSQMPASICVLKHLRSNRNAFVQQWAMCTMSGATDWANNVPMQPFLRYYSNQEECLCLIVGLNKFSYY
jgi:hypothetical protein